MIKDVKFSDLYIRIDQPDQARYRPIMSEIEDHPNVAVPDIFASDIEFMRQMILEKDRDECSIAYDDIRLRVAKQTMSDGSIWAAMRKISNEAPLLDNLGIDPVYIPELRNLGKRSGGLIIFCGATGEGKTTTSTALQYDFLMKYGDLAYTIEDPVEYNYSGPVGEGGYCYQVEVSEDHEWAIALKRGLRWHPRYIFVGEIRTPEAARQVLRAATSGHLVITTLHSGSIEEGLAAIVQIAESELGSLVHDLLANGLAAVINQKLEKNGPKIEMVTIEDKNLGDPIRACVRQEKIGTIRTYIQQQEALRRQRSGRQYDDDDDDEA